MASKRQQRKNRLHLADMLEHRIEDKNFDMNTFSNNCGTVGCALGIAVMSGEFGYGWNNGYAVKDGWIVNWEETGVDLFGSQTMREVFWDCENRSRQTVAAELRAIT